MSNGWAAKKVSGNEDVSAGLIECSNDSLNSSHSPLLNRCPRPRWHSQLMHGR